MNRRKRAPQQPIGRTVLKTLTSIALCAGIFLLQGCGGSSVQVASPLVAIKIAPTTPLLVLSSNRQLFATGVYADGTQQDITAAVTWSVSSVPSATNFVAVAPNGMATGTGLGTSIVSASQGPVVGLLQLTVNTDGYSSKTAGVLPATTGKNQVDIAYLPISQFKNPSGVYAVQAINLDADLSSNVLPVQTSLIASIFMPSGFVPNATAVSTASQKVAVISYSSAQVVIIDASNDPLDVASNTIIGTFTAPVTKSVTFNGKTCMICAAVVNPATDQLVLSTAQGYFTMDLNAGTFTQLVPPTTLFPAPSFALNPIFTDGSGNAAPYLLSPTFGQDPNATTEVQTLDLNSKAVQSNTGFGLVTINAAAINFLQNQGAVVDAGANGQTLLDLSNPQQPFPIPVQNLGICAAQSPVFDMVAFGLGVAVDPSTVSPTLFLTQHGGSCVGFEFWPAPNTGLSLNPGFIGFGYGVMPPTPDGRAFVNGSDPNAIGTFTSIVNKANYGFLVSDDQKWIGKINFATISSTGAQFSGFPLPAGIVIPPSNLNAGIGGAPVVYLPTTGTIALSTKSLDFGTQKVSSSTQSGVVFTNTGTLPITISKIEILGPDASSFSQLSDCPINAPLSANGTCTITVTFTPGTQGPLTATLSITDDDDSSPQAVALSGTGD